MNKSTLLLLSALLVGGAARSADIELTAWRGETVYLKAVITNTMNLVCDVSAGWAGKDRARMGGASGCGILRPVKYARKGQNLAALDRVDSNREGVPMTTNDVLTVAGWIVVPRDLPAGVYDKLSFGLSPCGNWSGPFLRPRTVRLTVLNRTLPPAAEWKTYLDLWQHPWAVARTAKVEPFSKAHYDAMRPLWTRLAAAGQKVLTTTIVALPWNHQCHDGYGTMIRHIRKADGSWTFDYRVFDDYVAFGKACGIGPDIACYTMCPWGNIVRWEDEKGTEQKIEARPGTPAFADYWGAFLKDFAAHLKEKGWFKQTFIAMDERAPEDMRRITDFIQQNAPGLKVATAGNRAPSEFKGITLDNYSQAIDFVTPAFLAEAQTRRAEGRITTFYVCCGPERPNTFMFSDPNEAFWLGAYPAAAGLDGFLRWAYNSWPADAAADASFGSWPAGDTFLVYPDDSPSVRWLNLQDGLQQGEKLRILRAAGANPALDALAREYDAKRVPSGAALSDLIRRTRTVVNARQ